MGISMENKSLNHRLFFLKFLKRDIIYSLLNSISRIFTGPLLIVFISIYLSPEAQGYWYTFASLAALSVFADLGFTTIVSQFSSHEFAFLKFNENNYFDGNEENLYKFSSLLKFVIVWSLKVSIFAFPVILIIGYLTFNNRDENINWYMPWILYIIASSFSFILNVVFSFYEGCNQIASIQEIKLISALILSITTILLLYLGFGLLTIALASLTGILSKSILFYKKFGKSFKHVLKISDNNNNIYKWNKEFFDLIWRYAISFSSGYFIFLIYTPLAFHYYGSVYAGKVGITMSLFSAIFSIANVWITTSNPLMNIYASKKEWIKMDNLLKRILFLSSITFFLGTSLLIFIFGLFGNQFEFLDRFLGIKQITMLSITWFGQIFIVGISVYLRSHKKEPLVIPSLISGIYISLSTFLIVNFLPKEYIFLGFMTSLIFGLPWIIKIFILKRKEWHNY
jgi:O-antigen/teichoic acid export membrane protein